ncbi:MAG: ABC transporter permease [Candidatus Eiseniibacteriota bacterium]
MAGARLTRALDSGILLEIAKMAWAALRANKLRSLLTVLGVIIGVSTVIAMVSLIQGLNRSMANQIQSFGSNTIYIRKWRPQVIIGELPDSLRHRRAFTLGDRDAILAQCPSVRAVSVLNFLDEPQPVRYQKKATKPTFILGNDQAYQETNGYDLTSGRFFTQTETDHRAQVCVIGRETVQTLFPHQDAVGKVIHIGRVPFRIVGELQPRGKFLGFNLDEIVMVPHTSLRKYFPTDQSSFLKGDEVFLNAVARSPELIPQAIHEINEVLRLRRGLKAHQDNDFAALTDDSLLNLYNQITGGFYVVMIAVAFLSLLVGGIGVMNIMLVSVTERTREIGVRMALGAKRSSILWQFLMEAMVLTGAGGAIGIALGVGIAKLVDALTPLPSAVPLWSVVLGLTFSCGVGLFFGIYPAVRASRLDPVEALRYE